MGKYFDMLMEDVRMKEGLHSCMNCGVCTGVCPAAEFYNYDPRQIVSIVQTRDDEAIERLLKSDTIWYCGECMSCRPRCPRGNTPGYVIQALRTLSQKLGFFVESEKGRQQLALKRIIGENILRTGYCIVPRLVKPDLHPEQGTVWKWIYDNDREIYGQFTPVYMRHGAGALRRLDEESLAEINEIFKVSGGSEMFDTIEQHSMLIFDFFPRYTICVLASIFHSRSELSLLQERMRVLLLEATVCRCPEIDVINDSCPYLRVTRLSRDHSVSMYVVSTMFHSLRVLSMPPLYNYASRHSASPTMLSRCSNSDVIMPRWPRITSLQFVM